jgi:hypothetical protein
MPDYLKILIPSAVGFITTVCAAFLSARWAVRRAYQERWWDRQEQAYREIIDALHDLLRYSSFEADRELSGDRGDHPKEKEFASRYSEAYWKVQRMTDIGPFVISEKAAEILQKLRDRPRLEWGDCPTFELREKEAKQYREALDGIRKCARADLKV